MKRKGCRMTGKVMIEMVWRVNDRANMHSFIKQFHCLHLKLRDSHGDAKGDYQHFRASFVSPVRVKQSPG